MLRELAWGLELDSEKQQHLALVISFASALPPRLYDFDLKSIVAVILVAYHGVTRIPWRVTGGWNVMIQNSENIFDILVAKNDY